MPGFPHCSWCHGKGCMCCDAERAKWEKKETERAAEAERRRLARLADPEFMAAAVARIRPDDAANPLRSSPTGGFRYCPACDGGGCARCPEAESRFLADAVRDATWWRRDRPDVRDLRDAVRREESRRRDAGRPAWDEFQIEALFKPALDAEYARQFPGGPKPIFTARLDDPGDVRLLGMVAHREALEEAFGPGGGGMEEIERRAAAAREIQQSRATRRSGEGGAA